MTRPLLTAGLLALPLIALAGDADTVPKVNEHGGPTAPPAGVSAKRKPVEFEDKGTELVNDPYVSHEQLTTGAMELFTTLYVDPASWPGSVKPAAPIPPKVELPKAPPAVPAVKIQLDEAALAKRKLTPAQVRDAIAAAMTGREVRLLDAAGQIVVLWSDEPPPASADLPSPGEAHIAEVGALKIGKVKVSDLGALTFGPTPGGPGGVMPPLPPQEPRPTSGDLPIENITTAWADIAVNGQKIGRIRPVTTAVVHGVAAGFYDVTFTLPNGFTYTRRVRTTP
jgi:hypothetical protein